MSRSNYSRAKSRGIRITARGLAMLLGHHAVYCINCKPGRDCESKRKLLGEIEAEKNREQRSLSLA